MILLATGDVAPRRDDLASMFAGLKGVLHEGDIVFGQLETVISDRGSPAPNAKLAMRTAPGAAQAIHDAGYDVVSFAGNHCLDWGRDALADTLDYVRMAGLAVCGAGPEIRAARAPAILEADGVRVAFLAYSSILPQGYQAEHDRPGCAPMRALTVYEQIETDQPGTPARVHTVPHREDLAALRADVRAAKAGVDFVAVSIHWGIHFQPSTIAAYQRTVAYAAIDDGADAILGHHPHILKGVEIYRDRPIFYSLGNFAIEQPQAFDPGILMSRSFADLMALNPEIDPMRLFVGPPDSQMSLIARLDLEPGRLARIAFRPVQITDGSEPQLLEADDPGHARVAEYVAQISAEQGLAARFRMEGAEVVVEAP